MGKESYPISLEDRNTIKSYLVSHNYAEYMGASEGGKVHFWICDGFGVGLGQKEDVSSIQIFGGQGTDLYEEFSNLVKIARDTVID